MPLPEVDQADTNVSVDELVITRPPEPERRAEPFILTSIALVLWFFAGGLITWLVADFDRALAPAKTTLSPWLIFSLFLITGLFSSWLFFRSRKPGHSPPLLNQ
jgi:hypothetical protein